MHENAIFAKINCMTEAKKSTAKYWVSFVIWTAIMIGLIVFMRQYFWLALPGVLTSFAQGMDIM